MKLLTNLFLISATHPEERACHEGRAILILNIDEPSCSVRASTPGGVTSRERLVFVPAERKDRTAEAQSVR